MKLDVIDLKEVLMEFFLGVWNGDVDLDDGGVEERVWLKSVLVSNIVGIDNWDGF